MSRRPARLRVAAPILAGCVIFAAPGAHGQSLDRFPPSQRERVQQAAQSSSALLGNWFGAPALQPDLGTVPVRWLAFERDQSLERAVIAAVTRQYWSHAIGRDSLSDFEEAIVVYTATRVIHERLEGSNFGVVRFFGDTVPFPLRSVLLSPQGSDPRPPVWRFEELPADASVMRMVRGLQTIERYVGWPAMAQALAAVRSTSAAALNPETLAAALSAIRGVDMSSIVDECVDSDATFDYAIGDVRSSAAGVTPIETSVIIVRPGTGAFEAGADADPERTMPVLVRFADGSELRDWFDGRADRSTLVYSTSSPLVMAAIDPEVMLLLDRDRANNTFRSTTAVRPLGIRLALHWVSWLQQMMLTYSAIV